MTVPTIAVFDSGLGGLTVHREIIQACPAARFVYTADDAFFPYGRRGETALIARIVDVIGELVDTHRPDLIVIACNTASTIALPALRARFAVPFVGTVPAIKPACAASHTRMVSVLGTEATVNREYTHALIRDFADGCHVTLVGSPRLAELAETVLNGRPVADQDILREIEPCFVEAHGGRTDTVVLACTHFPLLLDRLRLLAPWPVAYLDPAPAIARRVADLIAQGPGAPSATCGPGPTRLVFTSGKQPSPVLRAALASFGIAENGQAGA